MLSLEIRKELREYFQIKNITIAKTKEGYKDVNEYYHLLFDRKQKLENEKQLQIEEEIFLKLYKEIFYI